MNPYKDDLGDLEPIATMTDTSRRIRTLVAAWTAAAWGRSYAPGKWDGRQIIVHLAQIELSFGVRVRQALTRDDFVAQPFDQESWVTLEVGVDGPTALGAFLALRHWNLMLFRGLTPHQRQRTFSHPEHGTLTVNWILELLAGHELHHFRQLETIANAGV